MKTKRRYYSLFAILFSVLFGSCKWSKTVDAGETLKAQAEEAEELCKKYSKDFFESISDSIASADSCEFEMSLQKEQSALWNQLAQYLVGLRIDSTNIYYGLTKYQKWVIYQQKMWTMWNNYRKNAAKASAWSEQNVGPLTTQCKQLLYAFSGPDWPYAHTFFPEVDEYILLAAEPIGSIPQPNAYMTEEDAEQLGAALYKSTRNIWGNSFFVTGKMGKDLRNKEVDGVLPVLMMFMGRDYRSIDDIEIGQLRADGSIDCESAKKPNALRMKTSKKGKKQTITYICCDLTNNGLKQDKTLCDFMENYIKPEQCAGYLKAASYLPHYNNYSTIKDIILNKCRFILEDDSGIKFADLKKAGFTCMLWGEYIKPIATFKNCCQEDLENAYKAVEPEKLDFQIGYGRRSYQIGAIKKSTNSNTDFE